MFLSRFGVKHYKCLGEIDIPLTPIHVLIGENDAGKTSLLEAMAALYASSEKGLAQLFPEPWTARDLVLHGSSEASVALWGEWQRTDEQESPESHSAFRYGFEVDFPVQGRDCRTQGDWIEIDGEKRNMSPAGAVWSKTGVRHWKESTEIRGGVSDADLEAISNVLKPAHKYALDAKVMALPAAFDASRHFRLDPDGFGLATLLDEIMGHDTDLFERLRRMFCELFPQFGRPKLDIKMALRRNVTSSGLRTSGTADGKGISFVTRKGGIVTAEQASDGAILFLGFLALAHLPDPPTLLLIEEPENGIYPKRLGQVIKLLKEMVYRTDGVRFPQIILTTHSPYVASFFEPKELTYLSREPGKADAPVRARPLRAAPNIEERLGGGEFYLGELWYNFSEEDLFGAP